MYQHPSQTMAERSPSRASNEENRKPVEIVSTTQLSMLGTMDWTTLVITALLLILPILMILNIRDFRNTYPYDLRVGSSFKIQHWTAIVGVEFSLFGSSLLPHLDSIFASKYFTKQLTLGGVTLSTILNSQVTAPFSTQMLHGVKKLFALRIGLLILASAAGISYKFSFETMPIQGSIPINDTKIVSLGEIATGETDIFSTNLLDVIGFGDETSILFQDQTFIVGSAFDISSTNSMLQGVVQECYPDAYYRYSLFSSSDPKTEKTADDRYRVYSSDGSSIVDINVSSNGSLLAGIGGLDGTYTDFVTVNSQFCVGYVAWSNLNEGSQYQLRVPRDLNCTHLPFDLTGWRESTISNVTIAFMQNAFSGNGETLGIDDKASNLEYIVSYVLATAPSPSPEDIPSTQQQQVSEACTGSVLLATGLIADFGTGMTTLGVALQATIAGFALLSMVLLFWNPPPLMGNWAAQWLALLTGYDQGMIYQSVRGTSVGQNAVHGAEVIYLSSKRAESEPFPQLELSSTMGLIEVGKKHL